MTDSNKEITQKLLETIGAEQLADTLPPLPPGCYMLSPNNPQLKDNYLYLYPKTLEDIRKAAGVPMEIAAKNKEIMNIPESILEVKNTVKSIGCDVEIKEEDIRELAKELILFPREELENNANYKRVYDYVLKQAEVLPVLLAEDLDVKDGETYIISGTATAVFNSITVHGTGKIVVNDSVKVVANTVSQVN